MLSRLFVKTFSDTRIHIRVRREKINRGLEAGTFSEDMVGSKKSQNSPSLAFLETGFFADF